MWIWAGARSNPASIWNQPPAPGYLKTVSTPAPLVGVAGNKGPADDFEAFYREQFDRAVRFAWLLTGSPSVAEDIAQDAFISVGRQFGHLDQPVWYLNRTIVNRAKTWQRD